jgi:hypothetical protein
MDKRTFALLKLLATVIIGIDIATLFPAFRIAKEVGRMYKCSADLHCIPYVLRKPRRGGPWLSLRIWINRKQAMAY